jgi:hypothetical protein
VKRDGVSRRVEEVGGAGKVGAVLEGVGDVVGGEDFEGGAEVVDEDAKGTGFGIGGWSGGEEKLGLFVTKAETVGGGVGAEEAQKGDVEVVEGGVRGGAHREGAGSDQKELAGANGEGDRVVDTGAGLILVAVGWWKMIEHTKPPAARRIEMHSTIE